MLLARLLFRYLMPWLLKRYVNKRMKNFEDQGFGNVDNSTNSSDSIKVGDIKVDYVPPKEENKNSASDDEYVDFEEIDDKK